MEPVYQGLISFLLALCVASGALAQDRQTDQIAPSAETALPAGGPSLTGKERMGRKWMDEQRIDNCNVPIDKRGSKPRSSTCPHVPPG
ncbi:hypothetical protein [Bradyrhizobium archetypum]|jgi:hypothetical protein|uniref:Uncharacterized protein n=1 Tax=Bradyrhizobium archetypum TaxID=2721160 RepID=A0A7Y4M0L5_9BRAD|nr:hypothetical protein [Bradyrhizobium archetypum]NOJ45827.1 hypothetical protein [Bradyrhizobium archetypum]